MLIRLSGLNRGYFAKLGSIWHGHLDRCVECRRPIYDPVTGDRVVRMLLDEYGVDTSGGLYKSTDGRICKICFETDVREESSGNDYDGPVG